MAMKKACDVYGTTNKVASYSVTIADIDGVTMRKYSCDLSERAYDRLINKIEGGMSPPKTRKGESNEATPVNEVSGS